MAASPSYGERPPLQGYRRSFTTPARALSIHERAALDKSDADEEILFSHPSTRIYSFTPPTDSISSTNNSTVPHDTDYPIDTVETLPWRSRTETLVAAGPLIIEKVRGSAKFLKSGDIMHALMRNSQCWCVDNESKFVLRKGKLQYYRIELPANTQEDKEKVKELIAVFQKILRFERTPCPFIRAFHVDLPDDAITPRRKGAWKKRDSLLVTPETVTPPLRRKGNLRTWSMHDARSPTSDSSTPVTPFSSQKMTNGYLDSPASQDWSDRATTPSSITSSEAAGSDHADSLIKNEQHEDLSSQDVEDDQVDAAKSKQSEQATPVIEEGIHIDSHVSADKASRTLDVPHDENNLVPDQITSSSEEHLKVMDNKVPEILGLPAEDAHDLEDAYAHSDLESTVAETSAKASVLESESEEEPYVTGNTIPEENNVLATEAESTRLPRDEAGHDDRVEAISQVKDAFIDQGDYDDKVKIERENNDSVLKSSKRASDISLHTPKDGDEAGFAIVASDGDWLSDLKSDIVVSGPNSPETDEFAASAVSMEDMQTPTKLNTAESVETAKSMAGDEPAIQDEDMEEVASLDEGRLSRTSSIDSFHTLASSREGSPIEAESDEYIGGSTPGRLRPSTLQHKQGVSEMTITATSLKEDDDIADIVHDDDEPGETPTRDYKSPFSMLEVAGSTSIGPMIQTGLQNRLRFRRSLSPPPSGTVIAPQEQSQGSHLTSAILQKAATVAVVKPIEAVVVLVHILVRVAQGATINDLLNGDLWRKAERPKRHVNSTKYNENHVNDVEEEDDFGVPIRGRSQSKDLDAMDQKHDDDADSMFGLD